ncbi:D-glycero-alpha-D-manno-heptose 1-phosphate guanylyltransferase [bioreactor metagenome]|jgi:D-glycero-alpha-D-manno-heptose 1-phosphate guanylyltransferase|uniref:D-glycero-alpha-D-manno-heptose 1-phosphate guanylyltransferase n=1 Tax=bioreactor metagenome TaxID=1076179 RepID=A0A644TSC6_9ZZZZ|nr:nucleotidyltransferase family protein [Lentimicrobium sp.]MEA5111283.1 nucleotidyltransferase family protein [Lentimicrobium sp.]HCT70608.1 D-glycero-D-manno-heptose 1-phosphate guanosyltransferase [Bacteroidales bacterium]
MFIAYPDIIILAGGLGTRLNQTVPDTPKPMAPVNGKPFLQYLLNHINEAGFRRVILSTGYLSEKIESYFNIRYKDLELLYSVEDEPLGTGGAVQLAFAQVQTPHFMVMNGDTFFRINLDLLFQKHIEQLADVTMALRQVEDASRYGSVKFDLNNRILRFTEKSEVPEPGYINGGIYVISSRFFKAQAMPGKFSLERDLFESKLDSGNTFGLIFNDYFLDIGIPADYHRAQTEFHALED